MNTFKSPNDQAIFEETERLLQKLLIEINKTDKMGECWGG